MTVKQATRPSASTSRKQLIKKSFDKAVQLNGKALERLSKN